VEPSEELFQYDFTQEKREISNYDNFFNLSPKSFFENIGLINYKEENSESEVYQPKKVEEKNQNNFKKTQNLIIKNNNETIDTTNTNGNVTKKGRKNKENIEERRHNSESFDNLRDKSGTSFMRNFLAVLNHLCSKYNLRLRKVNFKKQFGTNCILNVRFIQTKLYKIFSFECPHNEKVILKMKEKNDIKFDYLMRSSFEFMYLKYINNEHEIYIDGVDYPLPSYITLSEEIKKRKETLKKKVNEQSQIEDEFRKLSSFEDQSKNLIKDLKGEGKLKKRSIMQPNSILCNYITIPEYD
jgi:hypothetical protein